MLLSLDGGITSVDDALSFSFSVEVSFVESVVMQVCPMLAVEVCGQWRDGAGRRLLESSCYPSAELDAEVAIANRMGRQIFGI
mmetsp:Transcript_19712/g.27526  ORF Transcript_19712/g.27526 Transcript_19712/m.27526 type:complete len:83 (-) Transcript_19712:54-302(-)